MLPIDEEVDSPALKNIEFIDSSPSCRLPSRFFFTLQGRLFMQKPFYSITVAGANDVFAIGNCQKCPFGLTTAEAGLATGLDGCR
jgi:hypothetical protein